MNLGSVAPSFGLDRFGNPGATSRSGHERNRMFLSNFPAEQQFTDISGISGADSASDGRSIAFLDYDRDGFQDMALVNANAPKTQLFHNQLGSSKLIDPNQAHMIAVRLVGGNRTAQPSEEWSARNAIGAQISVQLGDLELIRSLRAGEGLAAQHSRTMIVGIGAATEVRGLEVRWPSGKRQQFGPIEAGTLATVYENQLEVPGDKALSLEPYRTLAPIETTQAPRRDELNRLVLGSMRDDEPAELRMYVTTATWCAACLAEIPELAHLRESFDAGTLQIYGVPADEKDTEAMLADYLAEHQPAYELLTELSRPDVALVQARIVDDMGKEGMPAAVITDAEGHVLLTRFGAPSVSELRKLLIR